jgi:hypothetical protein
LRASLYPALPVLFRRGRGKFVQDGHTEKLRIDGRSCSSAPPAA